MFSGRSKVSGKHVKVAIKFPCGSDLPALDCFLFSKADDNKAARQRRAVSSNGLVCMARLTRS